MTARVTEVAALIRDLSFHLDELELDAVRAFEEADAAAAGDDGLFEDVDPLRLELLDQVVELVGVDGDVLHPVLLLALLLEEPADVELQAVQVDAVAAVRIRTVNDL